MFHCGKEMARVLLVLCLFGWSISDLSYGICNTVCGRGPLIKCIEMLNYFYSILTVVFLVCLKDEFVVGEEVSVLSVQSKKLEIA